MDLSSVQMYQFGAVSEFCSWVVELKACFTTILLTVTLEFRKNRLTEICLSQLGLKAWATTALLKGLTPQLLEI